VENKKAFTLIEILMVVSIIAILASVILVSVNQSRKNARINSAKSTLKSAMTAVVACNDGGTATPPDGGGGAICGTATWPVLQWGYQYESGGDYTADCNFSISTNGDTTNPIRCTCQSQLCQ
jgi:prepilin-type N-terminal cleavage/methylation domain-containing protein